jgi:DNA helicase MCM8
MSTHYNHYSPSEPTSDDEATLLISRWWHLYFPFDPFDAKSVWMDATRLFRQFFETDLHLLTDVNLDHVVKVVFDYQRFCEQLPVSLHGFPEVLRGNAETTLACLGLALCSLRSSKSAYPLSSSLHLLTTNSSIDQQHTPEQQRFAPKVRPIQPRFVNYRPLTTISRLKADLLGKFVSVKGNVIKVCGMRPLVKRMDFYCTKCRGVITKDLPDGKYEPPIACDASGCKSKTFEPDRESAVTVDYQRIRIQEFFDDSQPVSSSNNNNHEQENDDDHHHPVGDEGDGSVDPNLLMMTSSGEGRVPRTVNVELMDDLVDGCVPGDVIVVSGIVKALSMESIEGKGSRSKGKGRSIGQLLLIIEANAIERNGRPTSMETTTSSSTMEDNNTNDNDPDSTNNTNNSNNSTSASTMKSDLASSLTADDLRAIALIARPPSTSSLLMTRKNHPLDPLGLLAYSMCPGIFGHDEVKIGLMLGLVGGTNQVMTKDTVVSMRSDSHILVVGDPGMGKSMMLRAAIAIAPRGVYVCGNTTSSSGLTVTMSKDSHGEHSLEAGALVLADRGTCCIDEFDKMSNQHSALLEAMEQQSISIAKAGVVCTLCARTSVMAAANPKCGKYRRDKTLLENLAMDAPLLSRFDLVFMMVDNADDRRDDLLASHVVEIHSGKNQQLNSTTTTTSRINRLNTTTTTSRDSNIIPSTPLFHDDHNTTNNDQPFRQRISEAVAFYRAQGEAVSPSMLRKYIAYAKHYVHPRLSLGACQILQRFYLELRQKGGSHDSTPITTRQLESMTRLAQARAKLALRNVVTEDDARDVVSLIEEGLLDALTDASGRIDLSRSGGMSQSKLTKAFVEQLKRAVHRRMNAFFSMQELEQEARSVGILQQVMDFGAFIEKLSDHAYLLKKEGGYVVSRNVHSMSQVMNTPLNVSSSSSSSSSGPAGGNGLGNNHHHHGNSLVR